MHRPRLSHLKAVPSRGSTASFHLKNFLPGALRARHARARFGIYLKTLGPFYRALTLFAVATLASCARNPYLTMKLKRFLLRYYPPGIILEFEQAGELKTKSVDLLTLTPETDVEVLVNQVVRTEPLISENRKPQVRKLIQKLVEKIESQENQNFYLFKILRAHILPLTNCAFNKSGDRFITGSYDRTCKLWNALTGEELLTLEGHKNVVYAIAFNNPYGDKVTSAVNAAVGGRILPSRASHDQAAAPFPTLLPRAARRSLRVLSTRRRRYGTRKRVSCCTLCADTQPRLSACRSIRMA